MVIGSLGDFLPAQIYVNEPFQLFLNIEEISHPTLGLLVQLPMDHFIFDTHGVRGVVRKALNWKRSIFIIILVFHLAYFVLRLCLFKLNCSFFVNFSFCRDFWLRPTHPLLRLLRHLITLRSHILSIQSVVIDGFLLVLLLIRACLNTKTNGWFSLANLRL